MHEFKLDSEPKIKSGFTLPDNYFEDFTEKITLQLPTAESKVISIWKKNKKIVYAVAAILVLSFSIPILNFINTDSNEVSSIEVENYLSYHSSLSDDDIVELLETEDLEKLDLNTTIKDQVLEELLIDNVSLENYITN